MTILDVITSSPINVFFTIVIGIGLAYLYCRKPSNSSSPSSSSSTSSSISRSTHNHFRAYSAAQRAAYGLETSVVDEELQRTIAQIERQERDMIRQEQDEAYQQSLKADREKKLKREEEQRKKEEQERTEKDLKEQKERLHQRLTKLKEEIVDKLPDKLLASREDLVKLVFKLPDGSRVKRDFSRSDKLKLLHWFVFSLPNAPLQFRMTTNFPKRELPGRPPAPEDFEETTKSEHRNSTEPNCELTLEEAGLTETQIIFVYDLEA